MCGSRQYMWLPGLSACQIQRAATPLGCPYRQVFCFGVGLVGTQSDVVTVEAAPVCLLDAVNNFLTTERLRLRAEREDSIAAAAADDLEAAQTGSLASNDAPSARSASSVLSPQ